MPSRSSTEARKSAAWRVSPGGFEVSIATYSRRRRAASSAACPARIEFATRHNAIGNRTQGRPFSTSSLLEYSGLPVLLYAIPFEIAAVHRDVDTRRQHLHEGQGA